MEDVLAGEHRLSWFLEIMTNVVRTKMLEAEGGRESEKYVQLLGKIDDSARQLKRNVNSRLALENLMLNLCGPIS